MEKKAYSIPDFLEAYSLSRSTLYRLWQENRGPHTLRVGRKVLIPVEAAQEWARSMEAEVA